MKDHGKTDMHQMAKRLYNKYLAEDVTDYAPIAKALCMLDKTTKQALQKKFEIAYFIITVDSLNIRHIKKKFVSPNFNRELETNWLNKKNGEIFRS